MAGISAIHTSGVDNEFSSKSHHTIHCIPYTANFFELGLCTKKHKNYCRRVAPLHYTGTKV